MACGVYDCHLRQQLPALGRLLWSATVIRLVTSHPSALPSPPSPPSLPSPSSLPSPPSLLPAEVVVQYSAPLYTAVEEDGVASLTLLLLGEASIPVTVTASAAPLAPDSERAAASRELNQALCPV